MVQPPAESTASNWVKKGPLKVGLAYFSDVDSTSSPSILLVVEVRA